MSSFYVVTFQDFCLFFFVSTVPLRSGVSHRVFATIRRVLLFDDGRARSAVLLGSVGDCRPGAFYELYLPSIVPFIRKASKRPRNIEEDHILSGKLF